MADRKGWKRGLASSICAHLGPQGNKKRDGVIVRGSAVDMLARAHCDRNCAQKSSAYNELSFLREHINYYRRYGEDEVPQIYIIPVDHTFGVSHTTTPDMAFLLEGNGHSGKRQITVEYKLRRGIPFDRRARRKLRSGIQKAITQLAGHKFNRSGYKQQYMIVLHLNCHDPQPIVSSVLNTLNDPWGSGVSQKVSKLNASGFRKIRPNLTVKLRLTQADLPQPTNYRFYWTETGWEYSSGVTPFVI